MKIRLFHPTTLRLRNSVTQAHWMASAGFYDMRRNWARVQNMREM